MAVTWLLLAIIPPGPGLLAAPAGGMGALIQERGSPLPSGRLRGGTRVALERAEGGDTPVLTFRSDRGAVRLLLDTGAAMSMVSPALVKRLGLVIRPLSPDQFSLAGGGEACADLALSSTQLPELRLASGSSHRLDVGLRGLEAFVLPVVALPRGIDGVLGAAVLKQVPFVVDPYTERVLFGPPAMEWRQRMSNPPEVIPLFWRRGVPLSVMRVRAGSEGIASTVEALMDTGAEGLFLTPELAAKLRPLGKAQSARLVGVCGQQQVWRQRLMGIGLGPQAPPIQTVEAFLTRNPVFSLLGVEAIVGQDVLRHRRQLWRLDAEPPTLELW